jgi:formiminoglutamase
MNTHYLPPDPSQWQGPSDTPSNSCFFQIVKPINLLKTTISSENQTSFALLGLRSDEGVRRNHGRIGTIEAPTAIRQALAKLPVQKQNFACYDAGNIMCHDGDLETSLTAFSEAIALLLEQNIIPIGLGGGHEIAWGHFQGIANVFSKQDLSVVSFSPHINMKPLSTSQHGNAGTPFLQIAKAHQATNKRFDYSCIGLQQAANIKLDFETAKKYETHLILAEELHLGFIEKCVDFVDRAIDQNDQIYVSLSMDVFAATCAPAVSAIQPLGLNPWQVIPFIRQLSASGKVIGFDIAELAPRYDIDHRTAKLAAHLIYEFIHHYNLQPRAW